MLGSGPPTPSSSARDREGDPAGSLGFPGGPSAEAGGAALVVAGLLVLMGGSLALSRWATAHAGPTCATQGMVRPLDGRTGTCLDAARGPHPLRP